MVMMKLNLSAGYAWDTVRALVGRELRIRYKGSLLGLLWAVLSPLGTVAVLYVLFSVVLSLDIPNYAAFIYSGLLPWTWFQASVQTGSSTLLDNRDLVRKPFFSRPLLPAVVTSTNFVLYLLALPVLVVLLLVEGVPLRVTILLLPLIWAVQGILTLAFTILVAALGVLVRDIQHLLGVGLLLWFYLTPVFYDLGRIAPQHARWLLLNPMAVIVQAHRAVTLDGRPPDFIALAAVSAGGLILLAASLAIFRTLEDAFVEEV